MCTSEEVQGKGVLSEFLKGCEFQREKIHRGSTRGCPFPQRLKRAYRDPRLKDEAHFGADSVRNELAPEVFE